MLPKPAPATRSRLHRTVWTLGFVSLFMDVSSEMVHALLPIFLTGTLGASLLLVGLIEGIGEATASIVKVFSGYASDRFRRRKALILLGYGLGAVSKPLFAIAGAPTLVLAARFADRVGKGIRGAPRDALIADVTPPSMRGRAFGLRQSLDTAGAFIGPLLAVGLLLALSSNIRAVFWLAAIPGVIAVLLIFTLVQEARPVAHNEAPVPIRLGDLRRLPRSFWKVVGVGAAFMLARFSEAFLILKVSQAGLPLVYAPLALVAMNFIYSLGAYPAGILSDRVSAASLLLVSLAALIGADLVLALTNSLWSVFVGIGLWGLHMALSQGLLSKMIADQAPPSLRGSAFGMFNLFTGIMVLMASLIAGLMWDQFGPQATFLAGAGFASVCAVLVSFIMTGDGMKAPSDLETR